MIMISQYINCPKPNIQYRYVPRDLDQLMKDQQFTADTFTTVFGENEIWLESVNNKKLGSPLTRPKT